MNFILEKYHSVGIYFHSTLKFSYKIQTLPLRAFRQLKTASPPWALSLRDLSKPEDNERSGYVER